MAHVTKTSALKLWEVFPDFTQHFIVLGNEPSLEDVQQYFPVLERFTVLLYDRNSNLLNTNECRRDLFFQDRMIDNISSTSSALFNHVLRASYIAGYVWKQTLLAVQNLPSPEVCGWKCSNNQFQIGRVYQKHRMQFVN